MSLATPHSLDTPIKPRSRFFWVRLIFLPVLLIGAGFFFSVTVRPLFLMRDARSWQETPCVVESISVIFHPDSEGNKGTYSVETVYHYIWAGQALTSRRYSFVEGAWAGRRSKEAAVKVYPRGKAMCFVNPRAPQQAVLDRGWHPEMGMGGFGLTFALAAGLIIAFPGQIAGRQSAAANPTAAAKTVRRGAQPSNYTPLGTFLRMLIGALVWNGVIGSIAYFLSFVEDKESVETGPKVIIWIFLGAGFLLLIQAVTDFFAIFKPPTPSPAK